MVARLLVLPQQTPGKVTPPPATWLRKKRAPTRNMGSLCEGKRLYGAAGPEQTQPQANPNKREFFLKLEFLASRHGYDSETIYMMMKGR